MRRTAAKLLLASVFVLVMTFAGMAVFGMGGGMAGMASHGCVDAACSPMHDTGTSGVDCLDHCVGSIPPFAHDAAPSTFSSILLSLALLVVLVSGPAFFAAIIGRLSHRWRESIGKLLLRQRLSTVILRN